MRSRWEAQAADVIDQIEKDYNVTIEVLNDIYNLNQNIATSSAGGQVYANIIVANDDWDGFSDAGYAADVTKIKNLGVGTYGWDYAGDYAINGEGKQDGRYVYNGLSEEIITGYEFAQNLVKNGLFDIETLQSPSYPTIGDRIHAFGREHKTLFFMCSYEWLIEEVDYRLEDYGIVPLPMGPDSDEYKGVTVTQGGYYFIEGDPDIEDAAAILVAIANRLSVTKKELLDIHFNRGCIRDEESLEFLQMMLANQTFESEYKTFLTIPSEMALRNLDATPRQVLEESAQAQQALVDELLNK